MSTARKPKTHLKMSLQRGHSGAFVAQANRRVLSSMTVKTPAKPTMQTSVSVELLDRLAEISMNSIINCDPKNATFSEI